MEDEYQDLHNICSFKRDRLVHLFNPKGKTNMEMGYKRRISVMFLATAAISSSILHVVSIQMIFKYLKL